MVPQITANMVGTISMMSNPIVVMVAFLAKYIIEAIGGVAIFIGIINALKLIAQYMGGKKDSMATASTKGIFGMGGAGFASNPLVVVISELLIGIVLVGLITSGSYLNLVNSLMSFGSTSLSGLTIPTPPTNTN